MPEELISDLELAGIRTDVNQLFVDTGTIHRPDSSQKGTFDPDTGMTTAAVEDLIYTGVMSVYPIEARRDRFDDLGQGLIFIRQYRVIVPYNVDDIQIRDVVRVTDSDDTQIIGRPLEVRDVFVSTILGYRRLTAHDVGE